MSTREEDTNRLKEWFGADRVTFKDHGKSESYYIEKNGKVLEIKANATAIDGAWIVISEI